MESARVVLRRLQRHREARGDLVARDRGAQQRVAARTRELCGRQRGREDGCTEMDRAALVRVVHLQRVRGSAVGERGLGCGQALVRPEHHEVATQREMAEATTERHARLLARAADGNPEEVEEQRCRASEHLRRHLGAPERDDLVGQVARERTGGHDPSSVERAVATYRFQRASRSARSSSPRSGSNTRSHRQAWRRSSVPAQTPVARPAR